MIVSEKIGNFCVKIRETIEAEILGLWGCDTYYDNIQNTSITYLNSFSVLIHFGRLSIIVFKIYDKVYFLGLMLKHHYLHKNCLFAEQVDIPKLGLFINSGKFEEDFEIILFSKMDESSLKTIKQLAIDSIKNSDKLYTVCKNLSQSIMKQFGGEWQCFVYKKFFGYFNKIQKTGKYILFNIAYLTF